MSTDPAVREVSVTGATLHCTTHGSGPPCMVLTSVGVAPYEHMTRPHLTDAFTVAYVELRGSGQSPGEPADLTFDVLAEDLDAVRTALGFERVAVLGHSILGLLALEYARRYPGTVSHVVAVGTPPRGDMTWLTGEANAFFEADATEERKQILRANLAALGPDPAFPDQFLAVTPLRFFDPRFDQRPLFADARHRPAFFEHVLGPLTAGWKVLAEPSSLRTPTLFAHGRYDYTVPHTVWDGIVDRLPHATFALFEQSGHQPFFEEPTRFVEVLQAWMAG